MKKSDFFKTQIIGVIILLLVTSLYGQKPIEFEETQVTFKHGEYPGFRMVVPEVGYEAITKDWTKKIEKGTKSKIIIEDGEYSLFGAQIDEIYENPINIYSILSTQDSAVLIEVTVELKPKEFISREQSEKEYALARNFIFNFGKEEYASVAKEELKEEEKDLKDLERDLSSLQNAKTKLEKSIVEENSNILQYNDKIALLKQDAQNINDQLGKEKPILLSIKDEEAKKVKEAEIKNLEKDKDKALKDVANFQKKIVGSNSSIEHAKLDIETNLRDQSTKTAEIDEQKQVVTVAINKLNTILNY